MTRSTSPEINKSKTSERGRQRDTSSGATSLQPQRILQRKLGNKAVESLLQSGIIQARLTISQPDDVYEQEADRVADEVMRMPDPSIGAGSSHMQVQRACSDCTDELSRQPLEEEEELLQAKPLAETAIQRQLPEEDEALLQTKSEVDSESELDSSLDAEIRSLPGRGQNLPESVRSYMEPRFNKDFSFVRIHNDAKAHELARSVNAQAFTLGRDVVFGAGHYAPESDRGKHLLAHELAHVVQQTVSYNALQRLIRTPYPWRGVITPAIGANIRSSPDLSSPDNILDAIPRGQPVTVLSSTGNWLRVESRYRGPRLEGYIFHTLVDDASSSEMAASAGTTMVWRPSGAGSGTDFETWASAATEAPFPAVTATTVMNCWEAVLLAAHRAGAITWQWIHDLYVNTPMGDWVDTMSRGARHTYAIPGPNATMPQRGDLVFFDGLAHIALATGNGSEVYTFWPPPNTPFTPGGTTDQVKVFTIEALVTWWEAHLPPRPTVEFGAPAW